jgi:hypothetical protein
VLNQLRAPNSCPFDVNFCKFRMAEFVGDLLDLIPGVGHTKAIVHYACGDKEGANKAWTSATRTVAVLGAGVIGHAVAGPVGAAVKATVTAVCYSSMTTALQEGRQVDGSIANPGEINS